MKKFARFLLLGVFLLMLSGITFAQDTQPFIAINSPTSGQVISATGVTVVGQARGLFEGNLVVRAEDANGIILTEVSTVVAAADATTIVDYSVTLSYSVPRGTLGNIRVFSESPVDGSRIEEITPVTYGQAVPTSNVVIFSPGMNSVVPASGTFQVAGSATDLPEGNLVVRARTSEGLVLAEQIITVPGTTPGTAQWSVNLSVNVPSGTTGAIVASTNSPADGTVLAQASVPVTFGAAPNVSVLIVTPQNGTTITTQTFSVSGTTSNVPEGNVVIQIRDASNSLLAERPVTATASQGTGNFQSDFTLKFTANTPATIRAFAPDEETGGALAESIVSVTFAANCTIRDEWPTYSVERGDTLLSIGRAVGATSTELAEANCLNNPSLIYVGQQLHVPELPTEGTESYITITSPIAYQTVDADTITVTGEAGAIFEGNIIVRVLNNRSIVITEEATTMQADEVGGEGIWSIDLDISANEVQSGTIYAYSTSPMDGTIVAHAAIPVFFGEQPRQLIAVDEPDPYTVLIGDTFTINGKAAGTFENNVNIQVRNDEGDVLFSRSVIAAENNDFSVEVILPNVEPGTRTNIVAFNIEPQSGIVEAAFVVPVVFGDPRENSEFVLITSPLPRSSVGANFVISGYAGGLPTGAPITLQVIDGDGNLLAVTNAVPDDNGLWTGAFELAEVVESGDVLAIEAFFTDGNGQPLAVDDIQVYVLEQ